MQQEILASSELYSSFPRYSMNFTGSIPTLVVPKSKYSSTETELTSDDDLNSNVDDYYMVGRLSLSGISTSAASSSGSSRKRRKRTRRRTISGRVSSSSLNSSVRSSRSALSAPGAITAGQTKRDESGLVEESSHASNTRTRNLPALNSIIDLKHATGRHRGISGSSAPAADASLFAMFYLTDIFDELLADTTPRFLHPQLNRKHSVKRDLLALLRKEILYSLRTSYFCPASKMVKLVQLVEEHYPLYHIQDTDDFLDLLLGELLRQPPFLTYSNGSTGFIHPIHLENYMTRKYYYQPVALTMQQLIRQGNGFSTTRSSAKNLNLKVQSNSNFVTVPYPALILKVIRQAPRSESDDDDSIYYWDQSSETHYHHHKRPVIPNLKIDITDLISGNCGDNSYCQPSYCDNWSENMSFNNSMSFVSSYQSGEKVFDGELDDDVDQEGVAKSRFFKGLKSAWKVVYSYLEDLTASSSHINLQESPSSPEVTRSSNDQNSNSHRYSHSDDVDEKRQGSSVGQNNNLSSSSLSLLSLPSSHRSLSYLQSNRELEESFTSSVSQKIQVKMELIAVISKSRRKSRMTANHQEKHGESSSTFAGYSVYCKAGNDVTNAGEKTLFAPWVLYESRNGSAPQVLLIENFGKWIDSLEKHHENLSLHQVPTEIRRILEDSNLFIYKRLEK